MTTDRTQRRCVRRMVSAAVIQDALVHPRLFPVSSEEISALETSYPVPPSLKRYWLEQGSGFFTKDASGNFVSDTVANRLLDPEDVLDLLDNADDLQDEFKFGMPFFEMNDRRFLLIDPSGQIVSAEIELRVICSSMEEFMRRIVREPFFYDDESNIG